MSAPPQRARTDPFRILVVCLGNLCRSPLVERLLDQRLRAASAPVVVSSAGVAARPGQPMDPETVAELQRLGGSADGFASRKLDPTELRTADLVLTATVAIRARVLEEAPAALRRTFTLRELAFLADLAPETGTQAELVAWAAAHRAQAAGINLDVPDPRGRGSQAHREAADLIDDAAERIAARLARATRGSVAT